MLPLKYGMVIGPEDKVSMCRSASFVNSPVHTSAVSVVYVQLFVCPGLVGLHPVRSWEGIATAVCSILLDRHIGE